jgi:hypothetical protein
MLIVLDSGDILQVGKGQEWGICCIVGHNEDKQQLTVSVWERYCGQH